MDNLNYCVSIVCKIKQIRTEPNVLHIVAGKSENCYLLAKVQNLIKTCGCWWWLVVAGLNWVTPLIVTGT